MAWARDLGPYGLRAYMKYGNIRYGLPCLLLVLSGMGCAPSLKQRAEGLWKARIATDCPTIQRYHDPRTPEGQKRDEYIEYCANREPFIYKTYEIGDIQTERDWGWVDVKYSAAIRGHENVTPPVVTMNERWQRYKNNWYLTPKDQLDRMPITPSKRDKKEEARLKARFLRSWEARQSEDWSALYELVDPRDRETIPLKEYSEAEQLAMFLGADCQWVEVVGDRGRVFVEYNIKLRDIVHLPPKVVPKYEDWIKVDGEWYRDIKRE